MANRVRAKCRWRNKTGCYTPAGGASGSPVKAFRVSHDFAFSHILLYSRVAHSQEHRPEEEHIMFSLQTTGAILPSAEKGMFHIYTRLQQTIGQVDFILTVVT